MTQPLDAFTYRDGVLHAGEVPVTEIADAVGTPTFVYSADAIRSSYRRIERAFSPIGAHLHYAVKASSNLHILRLLREQGAGMDVVSGGELERAWLAGTPMRDIVFAGVGKTEAEQRAALDGRLSPLFDDAERLGRMDIENRGPVGLFNVESESELEVLARVAAELGVVARACLRVNPDVDARTHEYTTTGLEENKFGVAWQRVPEIFDAFRDVESIELVGLHVHIGSPVRELEPYESAVAVLLRLIDTLEGAGHEISVLDLGGGWPMSYTDGESPEIEAFAEALVPMLEERTRNGLRVVLEPGRSILANSGVLLTRVQHIKVGREKTFVICDAGMHTLIRPAFYRAFHFAWPARVEPRHVPPMAAERLDLPDLRPCDIVGPICETGDFLARGRDLPPMRRGDVVAIFSAGAYGMSMSSNYNDHGRSAEVMVDGDRVTVINERQKLASLLETEMEPRELDLESVLSS
ncbi:MAG: diaminopimelate decarboxylase [Thermoanaerobaculales bacterium]|nr:diaminopimelate decarboxylase [Thermoanaerobaculales bacterium]